MVAYAAILAVAEPLLAFTPWAHLAISAPAAAIAGTALIALGAGMGAIAANNTGTRTGGGGGRAGSSQRVPDIAPRQVTLDPDAHARERAARGEIPERSASRAVAPTLFAPTYMIFGRPTPETVRWIADNNLAAGRRDLPGGVKRTRG